MNRRFLNRLRYPYLQTNLPENILPNKPLNHRGGRDLYKADSRLLRRGLQLSRGILLRTRRGRLGIYAKMMSGGGSPTLGDRSPFTRFDALERGSMLSIVEQTQVWGGEATPQSNRSQTSLIPGGPSEGSVQHEGRLLHLRQQSSPRTSSTSPFVPPKSGGLARRHNLRGPRSKGRFYQSISQLEGGISKRHEKRVSQVSLRLSERRKLRLLYGGLSNKEIDNLIRKGFKGRGKFSDNLFKLLESRLDVMLWRIGFFSTAPAARNWICRGRVSVNGNTLTVANYLLQPGDVVSILPGFMDSLCQGGFATPHSINQKQETSRGISNSHLAHHISTPPVRNSLMCNKTAQETTPYRDRPSLPQLSAGRPVAGNSLPSGHRYSLHPSSSRFEGGDVATTGSFENLPSRGHPMIGWRALQSLTTCNALKESWDGCLLDEGVSRSSLDAGGVGKRLSYLPPFKDLIGAPSRLFKEKPISLETDERKRVAPLSIRPSHVEISYLGLVAIYLYPPQRVFLPAPVDIEAIQRR